MAKRKKLHSLPKRIAGVKIPKALRRTADTPVGGVLIGLTLFELGKDALLSPPIQHALGDIRASLARTALAVAGGLQHAAQSAGHTISDAAAHDHSVKRRRTTTSPRLDQEEMAH